MTYEVGRRLIDNVWVTDVEQQGGGPGGGITEVVADDASVTVTNGTGPVVGLSANGGSLPGAVRVLKYDFDFTQAAALADGVSVWTPAVGDWLLNAWIETDAPGWNADGDFTPQADIGVVTAGAWANVSGFSRGFFAFQVGPIGLQTAVWDPLDTNFAVYGGNGVGSGAASDLLQNNIAAAAGTGLVMPQVRWRTTNPLSLVVSDDGNPGSDAFDGSAGSSTLYIVVSTPGDAA